MPYTLELADAVKQERERVEIAPSVYGYDGCRNAAVFRGRI